MFLRGVDQLSNITRMKNIKIYINFSNVEFKHKTPFGQTQVMQRECIINFNSNNP